MPKRKADQVSNRRPLRECILDALREAGPMPTAKLSKKVAAISGTKFHMNSLYLALRALKKNGQVTVARKGRQRLYSTPRQVGAPVEKAMKRISGATHRRKKFTGPVPLPSAPQSAEVSTVSTIHQRLAMGEIAIVRTDSDTVLSATNVHGELVLKRHRIPPK